MPVPRTLLDRITNYRAAGYSDDDIVAGIAQSQNHPDIAGKVQSYQSQGYGTSDILYGLMSSDMVDDAPHQQQPSAPIQQKPAPSLADTYADAALQGESFNPNAPDRNGWATRGLQAVPEILKKQFAGMEYGAEKLASGTERGGYDPAFGEVDLSARPANNAPLSVYKEADKRIQELRPKADEGAAAQYGFDIMSNVGAQVPNLVTGGALGAGVSLATMGGMAAADKNVALSESGVSGPKAALGAGIVGTGEAVTELYGVKALLKASMPLVTRLVKSAAGDVPGEVVQMINENAVDWWMKTPNASIGELTQKIKEDFIPTVITSFGSAIMLGGGAHATHRIMQERERGKSSDPHQPIPDTAPAPTRENLQSVMPETQEDADELIKMYGEGKESAPVQQEQSTDPHSPVPDTVAQGPATDLMQEPIQQTVAAQPMQTQAEPQQSAPAQDVIDTLPQSGIVDNQLQRAYAANIAPMSMQTGYIAEKPALPQAPQAPISTEPIPQAGANAPQEVINAGNQPAQATERLLNPPAVSTPGAGQVETPVPDSQKEPWQMTRNEYIGGESGTDAIAVKKMAHGMHVRDAVNRGDMVPLEVLSEYRNNGWAQDAIERSKAAQRGTEAIKKITERDQRQATEYAINRMLLAKNDGKLIVAQGMTKEQAQAFLDRVEAAPGDDLLGRKAVYEVYPDLAPKTASVPEVTAPQSQAQPQAANKPLPDIRTFFIQKGGISLPVEKNGGYSGELKQLREEMGKWEGNKLIRTLKVKGAVSLDDALTRAKEAGYLPEDATLDDLIAALREKKPHPVTAEDEQGKALQKFDQRKDTATREKLRFVTDNELARQEMHNHLIDAGIPADSQTYERIMGTFRKMERKADPVTGWESREDFPNIAKRMWAESTKGYDPQTGAGTRDIAYAAIDLVNMGGLNKHLNSESVADSEYIRPTADIIKQAIEEAGIDNAVYVRKGGDELSIFAPDTTKDELDKALESAKMRVWQRSKEKGVDTLTHAKTQKPNVGFGIYYGTAQLNHEFDLADVYENAEKSLYEQKTELEKGDRNAGGEIISREARPDSLAGQTGGIEEGAGADIRSSKETQRAGESGQAQEEDNQRSFLTAPEAPAAPKSKATQSDMFGAKTGLEGPVRAESVDLTKDNLFTRADTVQAEKNAKEDKKNQSSLIGEHPIMRYAHGETVAMIDGEALEKINALGFEALPSPAIMTQKTIDHIIERRPSMSQEDVDNLKSTVTNPTDVFPNIATEKAPYRANSVLLVKKNGGNYVTIVEITPGVKENVIWNFWKEERGTFDRYIKKFEAEKTRILQSGGRRTDPHIPLDVSAEGKPESLSGSQTKDTRDVFDSNIPQSEKDVKGGDETFLYSGIHVPTMIGQIRSTFAKERDADGNISYEGIREDDLKALEEVWNLPNLIAQDHPEFMQHKQIEVDRQENREALLHEMLQSPTKKRAGEHHEFLSLSKEDETAVAKLIVESDADNRVISKKELESRGITEPQMIAYYAWKRSMDKALELRIENYKKVSLIPYEDRAYYDQLKEIMDMDATGLEVRKRALDLAGQMPQMEGDAFMADVDSLTPDKGSIKELRAQLETLNYYMPRTRGQGEYVARVRDEDGNVIWSERTTSNPKGGALVKIGKALRMNEAKKIEKRLRAEFPDGRIEWKHEPHTPEFMYQEMTDAAIERFLDKTIEKVRDGGKISNTELSAVKDAIKQTLVDDLKARGFGKHAIHRKQGAPIGGYKTEGLKQVFVDYMSGASGFMSKSEAAMRHHLALQNLPNNKPKLMQYAQKYVKDMMRNQTKIDRVSGRLRAMAYTWYLMGNIRFAAVQMTQNYVAAIPELATHTKGAHRKYHLAMSQVASGQGLTTEEKAALDKAYNAGITKDQYLREVTARIHGGPQNAWRKTIDALSIPFRGMETFNRKSSFLAAWRVAKYEKKMNDSDSYAFARQFVDNTQFWMSKANLPEWARGEGMAAGIARTLYTFKSFQQNYLLLMRKWAKQGPEGYRAIAYSMAWLAAFGGAGAVPFLDDILDLLEQITGYPARKIVKDRLKKYGDVVAKIGTQGIPALIGIDLSGSLKMEVPFLKSASAALTLGQVNAGGGASDVWGVYSGLGQKAAKSAHFVSQKEMYRAAEALAPVFIENAMKGYRQMSGPVLDDKGRPMFDERTGKPFALSTAEGIGQMAGFRPARTADLSKEKRMAQNLDGYFDRRRADITEAYRYAAQAKDKDAIRKVLDDVKEYNLDARKYPKVAAPITGQTLQRAMKPKQNKAVRAFLGLDTAD